MLIDDRVYGSQGRPVINLQNCHDLDTAQHFLADHAAKLLVAFDHHAIDPDVFIYAVTPDSTLSAGDYYLWPLLHQTAKRIEGEIAERRRKSDGTWRWDHYRGSLRKWVRRMPQLHTLIRIRKSTVHALCAWDLQGMRPDNLVVLNTDRNLTGLTCRQALEIVSTGQGHRA